MYQALYRKWRPKTFDDVVGQPHITETLKRQLETDRVSHAYLFIGSRGTGKTSCAKILAKAVNCEALSAGNPCNTCFSCVGIDGGSILDVEELDAASNNGVDHVRALRDEAVFTPAAVKKRVYIVDEVHMLSTAAFNALLKILEEPPAHLMFILATTEAHKIPATILSRCQRHAFRRVSAKDIAGRLRAVAGFEMISLEDDAAAMLARLAEGSVRDGLALLDQCATGGAIDREAVLDTVGLASAAQTVELLSAIGKGEAEEALPLVHALYYAGKDMAALLGQLSTLMRDILLTRIAPRAAADLQSGNFDRESIESFSNLSPEMLLFYLKEAAAAAADMGRHANRRLTAELCIIRLCRFERRGDIDALQAKVANLERSLLAEERPVNFDRLAAVPKQKAELPSPGAEQPPWAAASDTPTDSDSSPVPPAPAPSPAADTAPAEAGKNPWQQILDQLQKDMDLSIYTLISDGREVKAALDSGKLNLYIENEFIRAMAEDKAVVEAIQRAADAVTGEALRISIRAEAAPALAGSDKLAALENKKFSNLTFK